MIVAGLVLILIGWLTGISILTTIGLIVAVVGVVLLLVSSTRGGRRWY